MRDLDPSGANSNINIYSPPGWVNSLVKNGISADEAKPYLVYFAGSNLPYRSIDTAINLDTVVLNAIPYHEKGLSIPQAVYFSYNNVPLRGITSFVAEKSAYDQQKRATTQQCGGNISTSDITQMSPFSVQGECFEIIEVQISQWVDQNSALVDNNALFLDFPGSQQKTNSISDAIIQGEAPYSYTDTSGAQLTIPRAQVLMYIDSDLELPDPPQ